MIDPSVDLAALVINVVQLGIAFLLALPLGWDREQSEDDSLGLRTYPLVAMASCGFLIIGHSVTLDDPPARARLLQGLMTGIGFLGGAAIVKRGLDVHGTATAASIWATAGIGAGVAFGRYEIAAVLSAATYLTLNQLKPLKKVARNGGESAGDSDVDAEQESET